MGTTLITELEGFMEFIVSRENVGVDEFKTILRKWGASLERGEYLDLLDCISKEEGSQQAILSILTYDNPYQSAQLNIFITMSEIDGFWSLWSFDKNGKIENIHESKRLRELEELGFFKILESIV